MKIFISWSGHKSNKVAMAFREWLLNFSINKEDIFVSSEDIDMGSKWLTELSNALEEGDFSILSMTKENITAPWIMFEAGALSKFKDESRVCPFLFDLTDDDIVNNPIKQFQNTKCEKDEIFKLVKAINKANSNKLEDKSLRAAFNGCFNELNQSLNKIKKDTNKDTKSKNTKICEFQAELGCISKTIQQKLENIMSSCVIEVFDNQLKAVNDYKKVISKASTPIRLLSIRGESYISEKDEEWGSVFNAKRKIIAILCDPANTALIKKRYESSRKDDETAQEFLDRYKISMEATQKTLLMNKNNDLYLHRERDFSYRMIFIDDMLYMSTFQSKIKASQLRVIKIQNNSELYSICEDYFNIIRERSNKQ